MPLITWTFLLFALSPGVLSPIGSVLVDSTPLDRGYRQMYNLDFQQAHRTFGEYQTQHPDDALGPTSDAAAYLFEEFERLGVLQTELFIDDEKFKGRKRPEPDPALKAAFERARAKSDSLATSKLKTSPNDTNARLAAVMNLGLESDYLALIEKRDMASLGYIKRAGAAADSLIEVSPTCYDAYLATGFENYMLGLNSAPVRWILRIYGAQTDKQLGLQKLELTATKGHYLLPLARLLLAVAAIRDKRSQDAKQLLQNLSTEFPNNRLYRYELERIH